MRWLVILVLAAPLSAADTVYPKPQPGKIGREAAVPRHLKDEEEFRMALPELLDFGKRLFLANWTAQDGGGRPLTKGNGKSISDPSAPLSGVRAFNRISGPDANS